MAKKVIDLSGMLISEKTQIKIGEKNYEVTNSFSDILRLDDLNIKRETMSTRDFIMEFFEIAFGKKASKEIMEAGYTQELIMAIIEAIQKAISDESITDGDSQGA
jgi:hypothetical protein